VVIARRVLAAGDVRSSRVLPTDNGFATSMVLGRTTEYAIGNRGPHGPLFACEPLHRGESAGTKAKGLALPSLEC
jgi:hypothetical protein